MESLSRGITSKTFDNVNIPADGTGGTVFAVPRQSGEQPLSMNWFTQFGTAPSAIAVKLQQSDDGLVWFTLDDSSNPAGECKTINNVVARFVRGFVLSHIAGTTITMGIYI